MAFDSIEKKRKYQREWRRNKRRTDALWHEREKAAKRDWGHPEFTGLRGLESRANLNERRWRFMMWEVARISPEIQLHFTLTNQRELHDPHFVFELNGRRQYENLRAPLNFTC